MCVVQMEQLMRQVLQQFAWQQLQHLHGEYVRRYLLALPSQDLHLVLMQAFEQLE